ncbi:MAG: glycosyltransferase, partial [bacterium]
SIILTENRTCISLEPMRQIWQNWRTIPLQLNELEKIREYLKDRSQGKNLGWKAFSPPPQDLEIVREALNLKADRPVWVLFTSSDDEVVADPERRSPFADQLEWIKTTIQYVREHPQYDLVIRVHPNTSGSRATGENRKQLGEILDLLPTLPTNARLVLPDDAISSYSLMEIADAGLVFMSTAGLEVACRGKHVITAAETIYSRTDFVKTATSTKSYRTLLDQALALPIGCSANEIQRLAFRFAYCLFYRFNVPFPLVKMKDAHTGVLAYNNLEQLLPGRELNLDRITEIILDQHSVYASPTPAQQLTLDCDERLVLGIKSPETPEKTPAQPASRIGLRKPTPGLKPPRVSVIIPCYNYARYLQEAVNSVLAQTFQDIEIIIVNDGSTDESQYIAEELVRAHPDYRLQLICTENSGQPASSRNRGIQEAHGDFILCLDADDALEASLLEECVRLLDSDPNIAIAYTDRKDFDGVEQVVYSREYDYALLKHANFISYCALYRREVWETVGGYRLNVKGVEDWDFWIAASARGYSGKRLPKPLFKYRRHDSGVFQQVLKDYERKFAQIVLNNQDQFNQQTIVWATQMLQAEQRKPPLVSVIVPTYNRPETLAAALKSILAQTFSDYEVIVVNDAGADVEDVIKGLNIHDNIRYITHSENRGLAAARNTGIRAARSKYIAYLDDDDIYYPEHLETLVRFLENSDFKAAYTDAYRATQVKQDGKYVTTRKEILYSFDFDPNQILIGNFIPVLCVMHERSCLDTVGLFDESLPSHEDWDFWIRISSENKFGHIKKTTCEFVWRTDGPTMTSKIGLDHLKPIETIYRKHRSLTAGKPKLREAQKHYLQQTWLQHLQDQSGKNSLSDVDILDQFLGLELIAYPQLEGTISRIRRYLAEGRVDLAMRILQREMGELARLSPLLRRLERPLVVD